MCVGNGSKVDVIVVDTLPLHLPSGLVLDLNNCYLVLALSMDIISGSCLMRGGYSGLKLVPKVDVEVACRRRSHRLWNHFPRTSSPRP